ncbi:complement C1q tumor necrosis factor-related protein 7 [Biomphalaria glabrata]|nr:hypothetical protein BgiMline_012101 [Biomphalaria glabrata]
MTSTQALLLKEKLEAVNQQKLTYIKTTQVLDNCIFKAQKIIDELMRSERRSAAAAMKVAIYLDSLEEKLTLCQNVMKSLEDMDVDSPDVISHVTTSDSLEYNLATVSQETNNTVIEILKTQVEELQSHYISWQETNKKEVIDKIQQMETDIFLMKEAHQSEIPEMDTILQNVELKQLLIDEIQVKNNEKLNTNSLEMSRLRADIASLQDQVHGFQVGDIEKLKKEISGLVKLRDILNERNKTVTSRSELASNVEHLQEEILNIQAEIRSNEQNVNISKDDDPDIAKANEMSNVLPVFSVNVSSSYTILPKKKLIFTTPSLNKWGCFNQQDAVFEAPVNGIYFFSISVNADSPGELCLGIIHNNKSTALCSTCGTKNAQSSTSVLLELAEGDKVWVEADRQTDIKGVKIGSGYSNFIGFRVR